MAIPMLKIRRPLGRLIFNMGIAIPGKTVFLIETAPWSLGGNLTRIYGLWFKGFFHAVNNLPIITMTSHERHVVLSHRSFHCLLLQRMRTRIKETSKSALMALCERNSPVTINSPHKGPVRRIKLPFDDVRHHVMNCKVCIPGMNI